MKFAPVRCSQEMLDSVSLWRSANGFRGPTRIFATAISPGSQSAANGQSLAQLGGIAPAQSDGLCGATACNPPRG